MNAPEKPLHVQVHELLTGKPCGLHTVGLHSRLGGFTDWMTDDLQSSVPYYDRDIGIAWKLVDAMEACEYCTVKTETSHYHGKRCIVSAAHPSQRSPDDIVKRDANSAALCPESVQSMAHAICVAFLAACKPNEGSHD